MKYTDICEAKSKKEMVTLFNKALDELVKKEGGTRESHRPMQLHNVGYFSGYYDQKTMDKVKKWLGAKHPVFG